MRAKKIASIESSPVVSAGRRSAGRHAPSRPKPARQAMLASRTRRREGVGDEAVDQRLGAARADPDRSDEGEERRARQAQRHRDEDARPEQDARGHDQPERGGDVEARRKKSERWALEPARSACSRETGTLLAGKIGRMIPAGEGAGKPGREQVYGRARQAFILRQAEAGVPIGDICQKAGISRATFYSWRKKYAGMAPPEMRRLKVLEDENARLKKLVAMSLGPLAFHWLILPGSGSWRPRFRSSGGYPSAEPAPRCS